MDEDPEPAAPTIRDVAELAGVSLSSVSRVLSGHPDVSRRMRSRVLESVETLGYQPDLLAQSLRSGATRTVGFVVRDIANPLFALMVRRCEQVLRVAGYSLLLTNSDGSVEVEAENITLLGRRRVDGLIVSLVSETAPAAQTALLGAKIPVVLLDREMKGLNAAAVLCDHYTGVRHAVDDLMKRGHRLIALVSGSLDVRTSRERRRAYLDSFKAHRVPVDRKVLRFGSFSEDYAQSEVEKMFRGRTERPTALLTGGSLATIGALAAFVSLGIEAGDEVELVALDQWPVLRALRPDIPVVSRDAELMGELAAELLLEVLGGSAPRTVTIETAYHCGQRKRAVL